MLNPKVFKAYDIRGVYGVDWDAAGAALIARAFIEKFEIKQLVLGWDMRVSSPEMVAAIETAAVEMGVHLVKVGLVTTPVLYFATIGISGNDGGIMVTASHNTGEWNGMKFLLGDGTPVGEASGLLDVKELALRGEFKNAAAVGTVETRDVIENCFDVLFSKVTFDASKPVSVVIDCGNGMEGAVIHQLLARIPSVSAHVMYDTPDGTFPHHEANPLKEETLEDLRHEVVARGAAVGIAFDGDGDRIGFVDERGVQVSGDVLTGLIACELLKSNPGATILYDLRSRSAVGRAITGNGGRAIMSRVGHTFIKKQMREVGAIFAGELAGHFYFKDYFGVECSDMVLLLILNLLQSSGKPLSELASDFLSDSHSGEINFAVEDRAAALARIEEMYAPIAAKITKIDGLLFEMGDWWFSVRPSNTEPLLRLILEARDEMTMREKIIEVQSLIV
ncbi:MAG: phosphomannomutase/phosphoglucomutase [Candidatus Magasanikbacteria bacterium]|nr:phosphomannomutase/phosphoglucomutase [Candidatus Magasanikbacteria bacterium]